MCDLLKYGVAVAVLSLKFVLWHRDSVLSYLSSSYLLDPTLGLLQASRLLVRHSGCGAPGEWHKKDMGVKDFEVPIAKRWVVEEIIKVRNSFPPVSCRRHYSLCSCKRFDNVGVVYL